MNVSKKVNLPNDDMEMSRWLRHQCSIGTTVKEIATSLNCARSTVLSMLELYGVALANDGKHVVRLPTKGISTNRFKNLSEELISDIQDLYINRKTIYEISYELKVTPYIVEYAIQNIH